jgi:hypothetical protein
LGGQCARGIVKASFLHYNLPLLPEGIWKCSNLVSLECYATKACTSLTHQRWLPYEIHHTSLVPSGEEMVLPAGLPPLPHFPTGAPTDPVPFMPALLIAIHLWRVRCVRCVRVQDRQRCKSWLDERY